MNWADIACIVFTCVSVNHLGLIDAIEERLGFKLLVANCVKCATFWCALAYMICNGLPIIASLAISFLLSYLALWLELIMGIVDYQYSRIYDKIISTIDRSAAPEDA